MGLLDTLVAQPPPLREDAGGIIRVGGTWVLLDTVVTTYKNGCSPDDILRKYPSLRLADIHEERERIAEETRRRCEERYPSAGLRERLLARLEAKRRQSA